jgi:hypothetical protein
MPRGNRQRQQLEHAVAALEARHGQGVLRRANEIEASVPHVSTGFATLDALSGCGGVPLGEMTLLSGISTSGKLTLAYKTLASTQQAYPKQVVGLVDLPGSADPDYLARAGVDLERLLLVRPALERQAVDVLVDLANSRKVRLLVVHSLADLQRVRLVYRHLTATLGRLQQALRATRCALIWIDDPAAPWLRWFNLDQSKSVRQFAALHMEMQLEQWLFSQAGEVRGYGARAKLHKSRWTRAGRSATVEIEFNGTIKARPTW